MQEFRLSIDENLQINKYFYSKKQSAKLIYSEIISGANVKRLELTKLLTYIKSGDTLVIASVDLLSRSLKELNKYYQ